MPDLRRDPVSGRWVIMAAERARRPADYVEAEESAGVLFCPFCEGNEEKTPPEIVAVRSKGSRKDGPGWKVRVVPNKFPALRVEGTTDARAEGVYDVMNGIGAHEVVIESPRHVRSATEVEEESFQEAFRVCRDRFRDLKRDRRLVYCMLFKNVGRTAGATLEHTHTQIIATPTVPITVEREMERCREHARFRGRCLFCDIVSQELAAGTRVVLDTPRFVVITPFASSVPFEMWVLPREHGSHFEETPDDRVGELATVLREALRRLEASLPRVAYNFMLHTAPFPSPPVDSYHWHLEIIPRLANPAGFEWGTGFYINPVPPESACEYLKKAV